MVEYTDLAVTPGRTPRGGVRKEHGLLRTPDGRAVDEEGLLRPASGGAAGAPQLAESLPSWWGPELAHPFWTENWAEADPFGSARQPVLHQEPKTPQPASRLGEQVNTSACRRLSLWAAFSHRLRCSASCSLLWMRWTSLRWSSLWRRVPRSTRPIRTWAGACSTTRSTSRTNSRACTCVSSLAWPWPRPTLSRRCAFLQDNKAVGDGSLGGRGVCPKADLTAQSALR